MNKDSFISWDTVPETWLDRCSGEGYETIKTAEGDRLYTDNGISVNEGYRPCAKCKEYPTTEGHDTCLGTLGRVMNACCGHGKHEGYIQFDNGVTIRGFFEVEHDEAFHSETFIRSEQEVIDKLDELEADEEENAREIKILEWVLQKK